MESIFEQASIAVELLSFSYLAGSFALYAHRRLRQSFPWHPQHFIPPSRRGVVHLDLLPPQRKLCQTEQLRQQCQQAGIKWRNAHGKNKHLKKEEMIAALAALHH
jgi:hypothetical protein